MREVSVDGPCPARCALPSASIRRPAVSSVRLPVASVSRARWRRCAGPSSRRASNTAAAAVGWAVRGPTDAHNYFAAALTTPPPASTRSVVRLGAPELGTGVLERVGARSTPASTSAVATGACRGYSTYSPCTPHDGSTTPPGNRSNGPPITECGRRLPSRSPAEAPRDPRCRFDNDCIFFVTCPHRLYASMHIAKIFTI
jgi:hypothetical protein